MPTLETAMMDIDPFAGYVKSPACWAPLLATEFPVSKPTLSVCDSFYVQR